MIPDLEIVDPGDGPGPTLYVANGYSGFVIAWDPTPAGPIQTNASRLTRNDAPGTTACIGFIQTSQGLAVLTGGGANGPLVLRDMKGDGGPGAQTTLGTQPSLAGDMIAMIAATLSNGTQIVHGGFAGAFGIGQLCFSASGSLTGSGVTPTRRPPLRDAWLHWPISASAASNICSPPAVRTLASLAWRCR